MPFFSIIIPTYNRAHLLPKAIQSVIDQTLDDWELIIVDDGSTDNTKEIILSYDDKRINYIYQENKERSAARNTGIEHANGEFICFLDSDDWYYPDRLEKWEAALSKLDDPKTQLFYSELFVESAGEKRTHFPLQQVNENSADFLLRARLFCQQIVGHRTIFDANKFNEELTISEDTELWIRISETFDIQPLETGTFTLIHEHEDRSINLRKNNVGLKELDSYTSIFNSAQGRNISRNARKLALSNCYFNIAKHHMLNGNKKEGAHWIRRSILKKVKHPQTRHRIYCLISLIKGSIPKEYN